MNKSKINVIKIPNDKNQSLPKVKTDFPRMPRMYLELIENKEKIKPSLVNKEYDPDEIETVISTMDNPNVIEDASIDNQKEIQSQPRIQDTSDNDDSDSDSDSDDDVEDQIEEVEDDAEEIEDADIDQDTSDKRSNDTDDDDNNDKDDDEEDDEDDADDDVEGHTGANDTVSENSDPMSDNVSVSSKRSSRSSKKSVYLTDEETTKKNQTRDKLREMLKDPPKLSELEKRGEVKTQKVIPNIQGIALEEEDELKRELLYKFDLLRKSYKNIDIPEFTMHSDYKNMNRTYENTLRRVSLDSNVENYKNYLIAGFMILEYVLGFWLKFDMAGFTQQQMLNINQYERLLIELGEKSYVPDDKKWPVEVRLIGLIMMNAVIFIIAKIILNKTGTSLFGFMNSKASTGLDNKMKAKRKMRGPNIDISSIPNVENESSVAAN